MHFSSLLTRQRLAPAISANDIENGKRILVLPMPMTLRLMDIFRARKFATGGVVITQYSGQPKGIGLSRAPRKTWALPYRHYPIEGYSNIDLDRLGGGLR